MNKLSRQKALADLLDKPDFQWFWSSLNQSQRHSFTSFIHQRGAEFNSTIIAIGTWAFRHLWGRGFKNVSLHIEDEKLLKQKQEQGSLILSPNHESYFDPVFLNGLILKYQLTPFTGVARETLNRFPLGWLIRRGGAHYAPRRQEHEDFVFRCLEAYQHWLLKSQIYQQVYHEGGRSRTGRLRKLKIGYLTMARDIAMKHPCPPIYFVPVRMRYDLIPDPEQHATRLLGARHQGETALWMLQTLRCAFQHYGDVDVYLGNPIALNTEMNPREMGTHVYQQVAKLGGVRECEVVALYFAYCLANKHQPVQDEFFTKMNPLAKLIRSHLPELETKPQMDSAKVARAWKYFFRLRDVLKPYILDYYIQRMLSYLLPLSLTAHKHLKRKQATHELDSILGQLYLYSKREAMHEEMDSSNELLELLSFPIEQLTATIRFLDRSEDEPLLWRTSQETIRSAMNGSVPVSA